MQSTEIAQHQNQAERLKWNSIDSWDVKLVFVVGLKLDKHKSWGTKNILYLHNQSSPWTYLKNGDANFSDLDKFRPE